MKLLIIIFLGGGLGSVLRFLASVYTSKWFSMGKLPLGTLLVNLVGCFLMGVFSVYFTKQNSEVKTLLTTGFCGGFTTFSLFSAENFSLWQSGSYGLLAVYLLLSVVGGVLAVWVGFSLK